MNNTDKKIVKLLKIQHENDSIIEWTIKHVPEVMCNLGINKEGYAIGGSVAAMMYGINIERVAHDIDIIVPISIFEYTISQVTNSVFYALNIEGSSTDTEFNTKHLAFNTARGYTMDIIGYEEFNNVEYSSIPAYGLNIVPPKLLYEAKKRYSRLKDYQDLPKLLQLCKQIYPDFAE